MTARRSQKARPSAAPGVPRAEAKRRDIIMAAAIEFGQKGYAETTLTDIARRLGIHTAALYYYFESKDAVVQALLQVAADSIALYVEEMLQPPADSTPIERLKHAVRVYVRATGARDEMGRALWKIYDQVAPELWMHVEEKHGAIFNVWDDLVKDAAAAGQIRTDMPAGIFRQLLVGSLMWIPEWYRSDGALDLDAVADAVVAIFLPPGN